MGASDNELPVDIVYRYDFQLDRNHMLSLSVKVLFSYSHF